MPTRSLRARTVARSASVAGPSGRQRAVSRWPSVRRVVGEQERVGAVVLVAREAVAAAQPLHVAAGDDDHRQVGLEQRVDDGAVRALDGDALDAVGAEPADELAQPGRRVPHLEARDRSPGVVDHAHRVDLARPVDAGVPAEVRGNGAPDSKVSRPPLTALGAGTSRRGCHRPPCLPP